MYLMLGGFFLKDLISRKSSYNPMLCSESRKKHTIYIIWISRKHWVTVMLISVCMDRDLLSHVCVICPQILQNCVETQYGGFYLLKPNTALYE